MSKISLSDNSFEDNEHDFINIEHENIDGEYDDFISITYEDVPSIIAWLSSLSLEKKPWPKSNPWRKKIENVEPIPVTLIGEIYVAVNPMDIFTPMIRGSTRVKIIDQWNTVKTVSINEVSYE